jgi:hypothetical protein
VQGLHLAADPGALHKKSAQFDARKKADDQQSGQPMEEYRNDVIAILETGRRYGNGMISHVNFSK